MTLDWLMGIVGFLLIVSIFANRISDRFGIPGLLLFLGIGMLAGTDGVGKIQFSNARLSNYIGTVALTFILFSGGLETKWNEVKPVVVRGSVLSTAGVFLTAFFLFVCAYYLIGLSFEVALLLSVIVSSTDAPAVFAIMRTSGMHLKTGLKPILEFESGSNDPMAVLLSMGAITILTADSYSAAAMLSDFVLQMAIGLGLGLAVGFGVGRFLQKWCLVYQGLYPVFGVGVVLVTFSLTQLLHGNGFLAVYLCGIVLGNTPFMYRRHLIRFQDSLAWIMQIGMFLILGLLVNPHEFNGIMLVSFACSLALMFVRRLHLSVQKRLYAQRKTFHQLGRTERRRTDYSGHLPADGKIPQFAVFVQPHLLPGHHLCFVSGQNAGAAGPPLKTRRQELKLDFSKKFGYSTGIPHQQFRG